MRLLDDVSEFVGQQPVTTLGAWLVLVRPEHNIGACCQRPRAQGRGGIVGGCASVNPHRGEVERERVLHVLSGGGRQRPPACRGGALQVMFDSDQLVVRWAIAR